MVEEDGKRKMRKRTDHNANVAFIKPPADDAVNRNNFSVQFMNGLSYVCLAAI
jgi:hypothetical protein